MHSIEQGVAAREAAKLGGVFRRGNLDRLSGGTTCLTLLG